MKLKYFILIWVLLNMFFFITVHITFWLLTGEYDIYLWIVESRHFFYYLVAIFSLVSLQLTAKLINKL